MSTRGPSQVSSNGLVFYYDTFNNKSYLGEPTTNYSYDHNPRIDPSYSLWSPGYGGTFATKHPDAIRVYNDAGTEITAYVNTGVTDWTNTYHAIWTYDSVLQRPVVTMRDFDGQWKAKYIYTGINFNSLGMTVGSKYTISWLQWTDDLTKRANVGLYTRNNSVVYDFWDGLSGGSSTSTNTLTNTWQRVYHTFTVTSNWNLSDSWNQIYMYGMDYARGTVKISDVQFELKDHPTQFSKAQTRSVTTGLRDLTGNYSISLSSAEYDSSANITHSSTGTVTIGNLGSGYTNYTIECWFNSSDIVNYRNVFDANYTTYSPNTGNVGPRLEQYSNGTILMAWSGNTSNNSLFNTSNQFSISPNRYNHFVMTCSGGTMNFYLNGQNVQSNVSSAQGYVTSFADVRIGVGFALDGSRYFRGKIPKFSVYNRVLTASEVLNNYNRAKSSYGL